jgi:hypothetical protein
MRMARARLKMRSAANVSQTLRRTERKSLMRLLTELDRLDRDELRMRRMEPAVIAKTKKSLQRKRKITQ